jgi:hypothetical protein
VARRPETFEFDPAELDRVLSRMEQMAAAQLGWINLQPAVSDDELKRPGPFAALFNRRSPQLTLATWTASERVRKGVTPESVGVQHSRPHRVRALLGDEGKTIPQGWKVVQDAPRRGLVALLPEEIDHREVLEWLLDTTVVVSPITTTGRWRAIIHWSEAVRGAGPGGQRGR